MTSNLAASIFLTAVPPSDTWSWTWPPGIVIPLISVALFYGLGVVRMTQGSARRGLIPWQMFCFVTGWGSLVIALDSPIHEIGEQLFWVHMTQHEILMVISAPLLVLSRPLVPMLWALPERLRNAVGRPLRARGWLTIWAGISAPFTAWVVHAVALWVWHVPALFDRTVTNDFLHAVQHLSFLLSAVLFWWALSNHHGGRLGYGGSILYVFTTMIHMSLLGALLTLSSHPWYAPYTETAPRWRLTPLADQQLGGLIMWIPSGTVLLAVSLTFLVKWMRQSDERWKHTRTAELARSAADGGYGS